MMDRFHTTALMPRQLFIKIDAQMVYNLLRPSAAAEIPRNYLHNGSACGTLYGSTEQQSMPAPAQANGHDLMMPRIGRASQFLWTRQLHPAAFSVLHIPAAFSIDAKGPTMRR
jgi:hypothetical protein